MTINITGQRIPLTVAFDPTGARARDGTQRVDDL